MSGKNKSNDIRNRNESDSREPCDGKPQSLNKEVNNVHVQGLPGDDEVICK